MRCSRRPASHLATLLGLLLLASQGASACSIPVFRYAMERWPAEPYLAVVFHKGPLDAESQKTLDVLRKAPAEGPAANLDVQPMDIAGKLEKEAEALWKREGSVEAPRLVLLYPSGLGITEKAWAGPLTPKAAAALLDSPVRGAIAKGLQAGNCAVWLLVESGDKAKDDAAAKLLQTELAKLEKAIELPTPMDGGFEDEPAATPDAPAPKAEDLKVAFSLVRASRKDPAEQAFLELLVSVDAELKKETEPLAFAIFGQGRALPPLVGKGIEAENIAEVCSFVCGPCSCQVKAMNPGWDLLMAADWSAAIQGRVAKDPEPPGLTGSVSSPLPKATRAESGAPVVPQPIAPPPRSTLLRNLVVAVVVGVIILAIASLALLRRRE